jgi:thiamine monophosphate kinase
MSDARPTCFGKLPFRLMDSLQRNRSGQENYWADAVTVAGSDLILTTIDSVSLNNEFLADSIALAILHSMNDIFAANGFPTSFSLSMILPPSTDSDTLSEINQAIFQCADIVPCNVGKLHTVRAEGTASATVSVIGRLTTNSSHLSKQGLVVLVGGPSGWKSATAKIVATREVKARSFAATCIPGPKKDVSGDGLVGALYQLVLRHAISIEIEANAVPEVVPIPSDIESDLYDRNYLDYSPFLSGALSSVKYLPFFAPQTFGPLICLTDRAAVTVGDAHVVTIGNFREGDGSLRLTQQ